MGFTVVYDACVLYPAPLRDLLVRLAQTDLVTAKWTDLILDECFRSIQRVRPDLTSDRLARSRSLMNRAVRDVLVTGYEPLIDGLVLPDPDDRHVVAAAIRCGAQAIVTANRKDFPASALEPLGLAVLHPDEFVLDLLDLAPGVVVRVLNEQTRALRSPPRELVEVLATLENNGLAWSTAELRRLMGMED
ncbi:MAG: PIN domain-containing protein [Myxococcales bacterium]|nr:PIN domain-containing protein [Myxococcales bacterium]MCB9523866.1 PIN domain-containing protein [Myxococcales bacterium]